MYILIIRFRRLSYLTMKMFSLYVQRCLGYYPASIFNHLYALCEKAVIFLKISRPFFLLIKFYSIGIVSRTSTVSSSLIAPVKRAELKEHVVDTSRALVKRRRGIDGGDGAGGGSGGERQRRLDKCFGRKKTYYG